MPADILTKTGYPARAVMESFLAKKRWRCTFDPVASSRGRRGKQEVHLCSVKKIWTRSIHQQIQWRSTLCCRMSRFLRMFVRSCVLHTNDIDVPLQSGQRSRKSFGACKTTSYQPNLDLDSELQDVFWWEPEECRDCRVFHFDRVFLRLC